MSNIELENHIDSKGKGSKLPVDNSIPDLVVDESSSGPVILFAALNTISHKDQLTPDLVFNHMLKYFNMIFYNTKVLNLSWNYMCISIFCKKVICADLKSDLPALASMCSIRAVSWLNNFVYKGTWDPFSWFSCLAKCST